jgi:hypothetical protein
MNLFENSKTSGKPIKIFLNTSSTNNITNTPEEKNINKENSSNYSGKNINQILHENYLKEIEFLKNDLDEIEKENESVTEKLLSEKLSQINLEQKYNKINDKYIQESHALNELKEINEAKNYQYQQLNRIRQQQLNDLNESNENNPNNNDNGLNNLEEVVTGINFLLNISRFRRPMDDEVDNSVVITNSNNDEEGPPMTQEQLDSLPCSLYPRHNVLNEKCVICEFDFCYNDTVIKLRCDHKFHKNCLINRLTARNSSKCPSCKASII